MLQFWLFAGWLFQAFNIFKALQSQCSDLVDCCRYHQVAETRRGPEALRKASSTSTPNLVRSHRMAKAQPCSANSHLSVAPLKQNGVLSDSKFMLYNNKAYARESLRTTAMQSRCMGLERYLGVIAAALLESSSPMSRICLKPSLFQILSDLWRNERSRCCQG